MAWYFTEVDLCPLDGQLRHNIVAASTTPQSQVTLVMEDNGPVAATSGGWAWLLCSGVLKGCDLWLTTQRPSPPLNRMTDAQ